LTLRFEEGVAEDQEIDLLCDEHADGLPGVRDAYDVKAILTQYQSTGAEECAVMAEVEDSGSHVFEPFALFGSVKKKYRRPGTKVCTVPCEYTNVFKGVGCMAQG
jgi:hypothetical protein